MTAWTKTPPTEPGWYWQRGAGEWHIVSVCWSRGDDPALVWRTSSETRFVDDSEGWEWQGPLRPEE